MNRYEKLVKNSGIFFIANFGSKIVTFLMVRFYTEILSASEYGIIDLLFTTVNLVVPIITLSITESVLRFSIDDFENRKKSLTYGYTVAIFGNLLFSLSGFFLYKIDAFKGNLVLFFLLSFTNSVQMVTSQFARGVGKSKLFAFSGFLHTVLQVGLNIIFLSVFSWGIKGYLLASIISNAFVIIVTFVVGEFRDYICSIIDLGYLKQMIVYSCPLIPNSVFWWLTQSSSRYIIAIILSDTANGLYAAANKIPTIISTISGIFFQAWQLSSVDEANSKDKNKFYTKVFNAFSMVLICGTSFCLVVLQPIYKILVEKSYYESWRCAPFLFIAMVFSSYSSFIGTNYTTMKKTKGVFLTTAVGGGINIVLGIIFTSIFGIIGSAFASALSFMAIWLIRAFDTRKFACINYSFIKFIIPLVLLLVQSVLLTVGVSSIILQFVFFIIITILYLKELYLFTKRIFLFIKQTINKKFAYK
ncbi:MAG: polysaccharide biosynthesis C-terminal domain-containing protein [Clostridia bacterium]|nr:polysaccharide biosynthesis C-terminal domain-containing protein [Clostridia bacterium]